MTKLDSLDTPGVIGKSSFQLDDTNNSDAIAHGGSSILGTYFNIVCITAGMGILSLPKSVAEGGWLSVLFIFISAAMAIYTSTLQIQCLYANPEKKLITYPDIGQEAFGRPGRLIIQFCHYSIILGAGTLFIMIAGISAKPVGDFFGFEMKLGYWTLICGVIVGFPYCLLRTMKEFVWMAAFGFLTTLVALIIVVALALVDLSKPNFPVGAREAVKWEGIPTALAVFSLAYAGNVIHPHLEGAMAKPKKWPVALSSGLGTVCIFYVLMSVVAYYVYGDTAESSIFNNLEATYYSMAARFIITIHVLMTVPILLCSFGTDFETMIKISPDHLGPRNAFIAQIVTRAILVSALTGLAIGAPYFMELMGIIGSLFNCLNLFHFPIACHVKLFGLRNRSLWEYPIMAITLVVATICFFYGGYNSIMSMHNAVWYPTKS